MALNPLCRFLMLHTAPLLFFAALYLLDVQAMRIGGADDYHMPDVIVKRAGSGGRMLRRTTHAGHADR